MHVECFNKPRGETLFDYEQCHKHVISNKYVSMQHNSKQLSFEVTEMKDHKSKETQAKKPFTSVFVCKSEYNNFRSEILNGM